MPLPFRPASGGTCGCVPKLFWYITVCKSHATLQAGVVLSLPNNENTEASYLTRKEEEEVVEVKLYCRHANHSDKALSAVILLQDLSLASQ
jgi:hypothetical protein